MTPHPRKRTTPTLLRSFAAIGLLALSGTTLADPSNKWRLEFSGNAESNGAVVLRITPTGGTPIDARVEVAEGTGENAVAEMVTQGLQAQLPPDGYHVERDDGEDVLIKKREGAADFNVAIISNTVKGVRINPDRE